MLITTAAQLEFPHLIKGVNFFFFNETFNFMKEEKPTRAVQVA